MLAWTESKRYSTFWVMAVGIGPALSKLPPCGIKENAALLILKHHMELVDEHMGALAPFPVEGDAVQDGIGDDQGTGRL